MSGVARIINWAMAMEPPENVYLTHKGNLRYILGSFQNQTSM